MIQNTEIYRRAVELIEDPHISRAYYYDTIQFCKIMYPFLKNGVSRITAPTGVAALLSEQEPPVGQTEIIQGNGSDEYTFDTSLPEGAAYVVRVDGKPMQEAEYGSALNIITFPNPIPEGSTIAFEWYTAGGFTGDFTKVNGKFPVGSLEERVKDLLAQATVLSWAMSKRNSLLEGVLNNLTDTDFKVHSPAASLTAKKEWVEALRLELMNSQNKLDWDMRNQNRSFYGY